VVSYSFRYNYRAVSEDSFPLVMLRISNPSRQDISLDVDAYLDSGSQRSLFNGWRARVLGLDLLEGETKHYSSTTGSSIEAKLHTIHVHHDDLGDFELEVGFSLVGIQRELLGRVFFNLTQIGFREKQLQYYLTPTP
jgi:hypothetical protein